MDAGEPVTGKGFAETINLAQSSPRSLAQPIAAVSPQHRRHLFGRLVLHRWQDVTVDVQRDPRGRVTGSLTHDFRAHA